MNDLKIDFIVEQHLSEYLGEAYFLSNNLNHPFLVTVEQLKKLISGAIKNYEDEVCVATSKEIVREVLKGAKSETQEIS